MGRDGQRRVEHIVWRRVGRRARRAARVCAPRASRCVDFVRGVTLRSGLAREEMALSTVIYLGGSEAVLSTVGGLRSSVIYRRVPRGRSSSSPLNIGGGRGPGGRKVQGDVARVRAILPILSVKGRQRKGPLRGRGLGSASPTIFSAPLQVLDLILESLMVLAVGVASLYISTKSYKLHIPHKSHATRPR